MEITPTTLILVGVICVILGFLASVLLNTLSEEGEAPAEGTDEAPPGGRKGKYTAVFRTWREKGSGTLIVEMDGKAMTAPDPLNEVQRERLERTVRDLRAWLGMGLAGRQVEEPAPNTASPAAAAPYTISPTSAVDAGAPGAPDTGAAEFDLRRALADESSSTPPWSAAPEPPALTPAVRRSAPPIPPALTEKDETAGKAAGKAAPKSIVKQIEDILQDMIAGTELERRGVHLIEDPIRGVVVQVGIEHFEGIDAVPDPQIKGIIQSAVHEWESSQ